MTKSQSREAGRLAGEAREKEERELKERARQEEEQRQNQALLDRLGGPSAAEDRSLPPTFLMEILEVREDMEQALAGGDPAERTRVESWARSERARLKSSVGDLLSRMADGEPLGAEVRTELNVWRYIERMIDQLDPNGLDPFAGPREH